MKIIIVEDEIRIREGIIRLLGKMNQTYEVVGEAENGVEGLELITRLQPDLIITDIKMPEMDGLEMLTRACEYQQKVKAIVLSAYSEFEYARKAMKLGVTEYLLKPISMNDFSMAMDHVKNQIQNERLQKPSQLGSLEQIIEGILSGSIVPDEEIYRFLESKYKITKTTPLASVCFYLGMRYEEQIERVKREVRLLVSQTEGVTYTVVPLIQDKMLMIVFYGFQDGLTLERFIQGRILSQSESMKEITTGWTIGENIVSLGEQIHLLKKNLEWNISLGDGVVISYPKINKIQTVPCIYPVQIENRIKIALCGSNHEKLMEEAKTFQHYFREGKLYAPKEIKECYVRFLWSVMNVAKEVGSLPETNLSQQKLLECIMGAKTQEELSLVLKEVFSILEHTADTPESEITHLTIKRTINMIQEFYATGITLDEIAEKLHITPEYLGTQFHREVGVTFSVYIKSLRMAKAKELLIGTQLKLYEIAEKVGYTDSKYFSKVFKETFGQLPADYRKTHR